MGNRVSSLVAFAATTAATIPLSPGKHGVTLTHPESALIHGEIDIAPGETITLDVTMNLSLSDDARKDGAR